jgi:hypothetical protein
MTLKLVVALGTMLPLFADNGTKQAGSSHHLPASEFRTRRLDSLRRFLRRFEVSTLTFSINRNCTTLPV